MRPLVNRWSPLTHGSHCTTTSWPTAATLMRVTVSPVVQPEVFLYWRGHPSCRYPPYVLAQNMLGCTSRGRLRAQHAQLVQHRISTMLMSLFSVRKELSIYIEQHDRLPEKLESVIHWLSTLSETP